MPDETPPDLHDAQTSPNVVWEDAAVSLEEHAERHGHAAAVVWFTGLSGSGKTTIARALERKLFDGGVQVVLLDGDRLRHGLSGDLAFSAADRTENLRRAVETARLFYQQGFVVLCSFVSSYRANRAWARERFPEGRFFEVFVDVSLETAKDRDVKGLYAQAEEGELTGMTGVDAPYEAPEDAELTIHTDGLELEPCVDAVWGMLLGAGVIAG